MRLYLPFYCIILFVSHSHSLRGQNLDANVRVGFDVFAGVVKADYSPTNKLLTDNGYNSINPTSTRYGVGIAVCGPLTGKLPVRLGLQAMMHSNENISGNNRTAISAVNTQLALELDVINKGAIVAGPLVGLGVLTSTIDASKDNQVGSFNGYVSGNARGVSLNHLTFPVVFGGRVWFRLRNTATGQFKRQGFALSGGYLLPLDGQNWYWANNVSLPRGPNQNTGTWYIQVGFGIR
ncbi:hypothetical protein JYG30_02945 [Fibrella sp. USSR17]